MIVKTAQKKNNTKTVTSPKDLWKGPLIPEIYVNLCTPVKFREHQMSRFYWAACAPSHKMGFRSSVSKSGLPGEERHEGLVPRNDVLTNGFI